LLLLPFALLLLLLLEPSKPVGGRELSVSKRQEVDAATVSSRTAIRILGGLSTGDYHSQFRCIFAPPFLT